jgi:curli biogenesis system outer membrane secretion channel CsgG
MDTRKTTARPRCRQALVGLLSLLIAGPPLQAEDDAVAGPSHTVAVGEFVNSTQYMWQWDVTGTVRTMVTAALHAANRLVVMNNDPNAAGIVPAQLLLAGTVTGIESNQSGGGGGISLRGMNIRLGGEDSSSVSIDVSVIDPVTQQVYASTTIRGENSQRGVTFDYSRIEGAGDIAAIRDDSLGQAIESASSEMAEWLVAQLPSIEWTGAVVVVRGDGIIVNRGRREALRSGMVLLAGQDQVLTDPVTGELLSSSFSETARCEVVAVEEKVSTCRRLSGDLTALEPGTEVRLLK